MEYLSNPITLILGIGALIVLIILIAKLTAHAKPYEARPRLLTMAELNFYRHLRGTIGDNAVICCMVRIADVLNVKQSLKGRARQVKLSKIAQKHLDFVIVDHEMKILCAIELNDSSHDLKHRQDRDAFVREIMSSAKVPLLEVKAARKYNIGQLKDLIESQVQGLILNSPKNRSKRQSPQSTAGNNAFHKRSQFKTPPVNAIPETDTHSKEHHNNLRHEHATLASLIVKTGGGVPDRYEEALRKSEVYVPDDISDKNEEILDSVGVEAVFCESGEYR